MKQLPGEVWQCVIVHLRPWEALQLRAVNRRMYRFVTLFQSYWYRQFTWYLICLKKREALFRTGCRRTHKGIIPKSMACLNQEQESRLAAKHGMSRRELVIEIDEKRNTELISEIDCRNPTHYVFQIPASRFEIPLNHDDYNPSEQIYLYRFLIHNYRQQRQRARQYTKTRVEQQLKFINQEKKKVRRDMESYVSRCQRQLSKMRKQDTFLKEMSRRLELLERNKVFYGRQSRFYRGLLDDF